MATVSETITAAQAIAFDALKNAFFGSDTTVTLLKQDTTADAFTTISTVDDSWWFEEDKVAQHLGTRNRYLLEIAKDANDTGFTTDITAATHVQINSDVYRIVEADTVAPLGASTTWKVYCERFEKRGNFRSLY